MSENGAKAEIGSDGAIKAKLNEKGFEYAYSLQALKDGIGKDGRTDWVSGSIKTKFKLAQQDGYKTLATDSSGRLVVASREYVNAVYREKLKGQKAGDGVFVSGTRTVKLNGDLKNPKTTLLGFSGASVKAGGETFNLDSKGNPIIPSTKKPVSAAKRTEVKRQPQRQMQIENKAYLKLAQAKPAGTNKYAAASKSGAKPKPVTFFEQVGKAGSKILDGLSSAAGNMKKAYKGRASFSQMV